MKKNEIHVGSTYLARVSGRLVTVKVEAIRGGVNYRGIREGRDQRYYDVRNLSTGRKLTFRSAAKFHSVVGNPHKLEGVTP